MTPTKTPAAPKAAASPLAAVAAVAPVAAAASKRAAAWLADDAASARPDLQDTVQAQPLLPAALAQPDTLLAAAPSFDAAAVGAPVASAPFAPHAAPPATTHATAHATPGASGVSWLGLGGGLLAAAGLAMAGGNGGGKGTEPSAANAGALNGVLEDNQGARKGALTNAGLTDDNRPTLSGQGASPGRVITLYADDQAVGQSTVQADGSWSVAPSAALPDGAHKLVAKMTDTSGLVLASTSAKNVLVDTTAPGAACVVMAQAEVGAAPSALPNGGHTNDTRVRISGGPSEPGSRVELTLHGLIHQATVDAQGQWSVTPPTLPDGSHTALVTVVDLAGNASAAPAVTWVQDTVATAATVTLHGGADKTAAQAVSADGALGLSAQAGSTSVLNLVGTLGAVRKMVIHTGDEVPLVLTDSDVAKLGAGAVEVSIVTTDRAGNAATTPDGSDGDFVILANPVTPQSVGSALPSDQRYALQAAPKLHLSDLLQVGGDATLGPAVGFAPPSESVLCAVPEAALWHPVLWPMAVPALI